MMFYEFFLLDKKAAIILLRTQVLDRKSFKNLVSAYLRVMDRLDEIIDTDYQAHDFFYETLDYDLLTIVKALDYDHMVKHIDASLEYERQSLELRVKEKMEKMNENKK